MQEGTVPFELQAVSDYLDINIRFWRSRKTTAIDNCSDEDEVIALCYIDAYQSVRVSLFGSRLSKPESE